MEPESGKKPGGLLMARKVFAEKTTRILSGLDHVAEFFLEREEDSGAENVRFMSMWASLSFLLYTHGIIWARNLGCWY